MPQQHNAFEAEVGRKWGLERGSNMEETKAKHRSTEEYKRDLVTEVTGLETTREGLQKQIHRAEIKLKGISTMIDNLHARRDDIQEQIDQIAQQFGQDGTDNAELAQKMAQLRQELKDVDEKLVLRNKQLDEANSTLSAARAKLAEMQQERDSLQSFIRKEQNIKTTIQQRDMFATYNSMVASSLEPLMPTLTDRQKEILEESGYNALTEQSFHVLTVALFLSNNFIHEATNYAESHGGGGSANLSGWGNDKDDDDELWWRRCISTSAALMRPAGRKVKRSR